MLYKYEMHLHTSEASLCGMNSAVEMVRAQKQAGYAGCVVTDHFFNGNTAIDRSLPWEQKVRAFYKGYEHARKEGEKLDFDVLFGLEYLVPGAYEFLVYGIGLDFLLENPDFDKLPRQEFARRVHNAGGLISHAHPYREALYIDSARGPYPEICDAVEVYNHCNRNPLWNEKARLLADRCSLLYTSGSDTHTVDNAGNAGMAFPFRIRNSAQLVTALKCGEGKLIINGNVVE